MRSVHGVRCWSILKSLRIEHNAESVRELQPRVVATLGLNGAGPVRQVSPHWRAAEPRIVKGQMVCSAQSPARASLPNGRNPTVREGVGIYANSYDRLITTQHQKSKRAATAQPFLIHFDYHA